MKFFYGLTLISNIVADDTLPMVGGSRDDQGCLISAGYTWCKSTNNCIRGWITPCEDNYSDCSDCLTKQRSGINIACPDNCDYITMPSPPPMPPPMPPPPVYYPTDPIQIPQPHICSDVMCMMYLSLIHI